MIWPWLIFFVVVGACVGSFLNVVIYRVPAGLSIVTPPSQCPRCSTRLAWYDNVPVLGWLWLRGRCRYCHEPISVQYPLIEALTAAIFGGLFAAYYMTNLRPEFAQAGFLVTWPIFVVDVALLAALIAATVIDARLYIIPLPIAWTATLIALIVLSGAAAIGWLHPAHYSVFEQITVTSDPVSTWSYISPDMAAKAATPIYNLPITLVGYDGLVAGIGAAIGLAVALALLWSHLLPLSFADLEAEADATGDMAAKAATPGGATPVSPEDFLEHPHPRREVLKELLFILFPIVGGVIGWWIGSGMTGTPAFPLQILGGVLCGYFTGAGLVWGVRILGTLGFGKEAMGLGDVHLLGAIGAVLGPLSTVIVFFVAPFLGLAAAIITAGVAAIVKREVRIIPYGPYLAGATLIVMLARPVFDVFL